LLDNLLSSGLSKELITVIMAMLPIAELRLALPIAINVLNIPWYYALGLSVLGNLIPIPFILVCFGSFSKLLQKTKIGGKIIAWLVKRNSKNTENIKKGKYASLIMFVAIPLPFTGAWTACLIAYMLGLKFKQSFICITLGVIGAGIIVTCLTLLGWLGACIAIVGIGIILVLNFKRKDRNVRRK